MTDNPIVCIGMTVARVIAATKETCDRAMAYGAECVEKGMAERSRATQSSPSPGTLDEEEHVSKRARRHS